MSAENPNPSQSPDFRELDPVFVGLTSVGTFVASFELAYDGLELGGDIIAAATEVVDSVREYPATYAVAAIGALVTVNYLRNETKYGNQRYRFWEWRPWGHYEPKDPNS